jgi:acylpyruvate hydrolase
MRFIHFEEAARAGIAVDDGLGWYGLNERESRFPGPLPELIAQGIDLRATGKRLLTKREIRLDAVRLLPQVPNPPKLLCVGLNYDDHLEESGLKKPSYPEIFARFATSLLPHGDPIRCPPESATLDYEAELAVVIGRRGRRVSREAALEYVAGYSLFNDATIREFQLRTPQWTLGKNFDGTGAFGPWLVPPDALPPGAQRLQIQGRWNGKVLQHSNTAKLIFGVRDLIAMISVAMTLGPGDVIITGTPGGVGAARKPPIYMSLAICSKLKLKGSGY